MLAEQQNNCYLQEKTAKERAGKSRKCQSCFMKLSCIDLYRKLKGQRVSLNSMAVQIQSGL